MPHYDYDKDYPFAAFITNLGKYNEGSLVGEWVKFPTEYYGAAEPSVRCGESHLSGLTEPPIDSYSA